MSRNEGRTIAEALEKYLRAEGATATACAWEELAPCVQTVDAVRLVAERARAADKALAEEVQRRKELIEVLEKGPNPLVPVVLGLPNDHFVVSLGRGQYSRVGCLKREETGEPILNAKDLDENGPMVVALDPSGSAIVEAYRPDGEDDLLYALFATDEGTLQGVDEAEGQDAEPSLVSLPLEVPSTN